MASPDCYTQMCGYDGSVKFDIFTASSVGDLKLVDMLLKRYDCNPDMINSSGWTALMYAAHYGHFNVVRSLIARRCEVDFREQYQGRTALMLASSNGHTRCIETLIKFGRANINIMDFEGHNAAYYAKHYGHGNNKMIKGFLGIEDTSVQRTRSCGSTPNYIPKVTVTEPTPNFPTPLRSRPFCPIEPKALVKETVNYNTSNSTAFSLYSPVWTPAKGFDGSIFDSPQMIASNPIPSQFPSFDQTASSNASIPSSASSQSSSYSLKYDIRTPGDGKSESLHTQSSEASPLPSTLSHLFTRIGLDQYIKVFEDNAIDLYSFLTLTDDDFVKLGISIYGHRQKFLIVQSRYHESVEIRNTHETLFSDWLLAERERLQKKVMILEEKLKNYEQI